jgi:hypothetical protein
LETKFKVTHLATQSLFNFRCRSCRNICRLLVLTSCIFYFPTTMVLMYCYGSIYHSQKRRLKNQTALRSTLPLFVGATIANRPLQVRNRISEKTLYCNVFFVWFSYV